MPDYFIKDLIRDPVKAYTRQWETIKIHSIDSSICSNPHNPFLFTYSSPNKIHLLQIKPIFLAKSHLSDPDIFHHDLCMMFHIFHPTQKI